MTIEQATLFDYYGLLAQVKQLEEDSHLEGWQKGWASAEKLYKPGYDQDKWREEKEDAQYRADRD